MSTRFLFILLASVSFSTSSSAQAQTAACDPRCQVAVANAYLEALVSHDAEGVALAPNAHRIENGLLSGISGRDIRFQLEHGPQYWIIDAIRDVQWTGAGDEVVATYLLDIALPGVPIQLATAHVTERFVVPADARIHFIEARLFVTLGRANG